MKTILVPTDFSISAKNAADYAAQLALQFHAEIILLHAYHVPIPVTEVPIITITPDELQEANESQLENEAIRLNKKTGVKIHINATMGMAVSEILEAEKKVDLIVMGIQGMGSFGEAIMGSVTTSLMRKSHKSILIVPLEAKFQKPKKIALACDYDPKMSQHKLDMLKIFMKKFDSNLFLVQVKPKGELINVDEAITGLNLEESLKEYPHDFYLITGDNPVEGINEFVNEHQLDLITVMPHHHNLLERLFHRSVSKRMAFHTHVPILTLPEK